IAIAFDALTIAYETKFIFGDIRGAMTYGYEWADMKQEPGDTEERRNRRGPFYAAVKRIQTNKEFFDRVWHVQPRCMALFGPKVEETFLRRFLTFTRNKNGKLPRIMAPSHRWKKHPPKLYVPTPKPGCPPRFG